MSLVSNETTTPQTAWLKRWQKAAALSVLLVALSLALSGCRIFRGSQPDLNINIEEQLPQGWSVVRTLQEINIDDDSEVEYLVFFAYDSLAENDGPIGVAVYDQRSADSAGVEDGVTSQSVGVSKIYRILPTFWEQPALPLPAVPASGEGRVPHFVAPPGQAESITITAIQRIAQAEIAGSGDAPPLPAPADDATTLITQDEIMIRSGGYITILWWENATDGYGVTQIHAPWGLSNETWGDGVANQNPLVSVEGVEPLNDRSRLCHKYLFVRTLVAAPRSRPLYRQPVSYMQVPKGIQFCSGIPPHPFFPEAVVLAYLLDPVGHIDLLQPIQLLNGGDIETERARVQQVINLDALQTERIVDIKTRAALPVPDAYKTGQDPMPPLTTTVCVDLIANESNVRRRLLFHLLYSPVPAAERKRDRLYITAVAPLDLYIEGIGSTCDDVIQKLPLP